MANRLYSFYFCFLLIAVLPDCTLLIKNIGNTVTVDKLKDLFPTSEDVVLPREKQDGKGPLRNKGLV